jgi:hypothetical protein
MKVSLYTLLISRPGIAAGTASRLRATNLTNKAYTATVRPISDARGGEQSSIPGTGAFYGGFSFKW